MLVWKYFKNQITNRRVQRLSEQAQIDDMTASDSHQWYTNLNSRFYDWKQEPPSLGYHTAALQNSFHTIPQQISKSKKSVAKFIFPGNI